MNEQIIVELTIEEIRDILLALRTKETNTLAAFAKAFEAVPNGFISTRLYAKHDRYVALIEKFQSAKDDREYQERTKEIRDRAKARI